MPDATSDAIIVGAGHNGMRLAAYLAKAGWIDLIDAGLKGSVKITGDMRILIRHAELVNVVYGVYAREIETNWPKGKPVAIPQANATAAH